MKTYDEALRLYRNGITDAQKRELKRRAGALSRRTAAERAALAQKQAETARSENALLADYGLAGSLYKKPSPGTDAAARRADVLVNADRQLKRGETAALEATARNMALETARKLAEERRKKSRKAVQTAKTGQNAPGIRTRTVTVRPI